ncbi:MAG: hypothetical protein FWF54_10420 [Candidatus Azobacteroides sp.]|nr:hypothetical protein [Candidatus Azobacteroides sp.]
MRKIIKIIAILIMSTGVIFPVIADKLPSQTFKEEVWSNKKEYSLSKNKEEKVPIIKEDKQILFADEPDPDGGEGGGTGGGGFVGSKPLPLDSRECLLALLLLMGGYCIFKYGR